MDFTFSPEQQAVQELAARIMGDHATPERVREVEASGDRTDRALWALLAEAGLLGLAVPEEHGGAGLGIVELALLLEQQGRAVAPVPLWPTLVLGALPVAAFGSAQQKEALLPAVVDGSVILTAALAERGQNDVRSPATSATETPQGWRVEGDKPMVPAAHVASRVLVPARTGDGALGVFLVDPSEPSVTVESVTTTNREIHSHLGFDGAMGDPLGDPRGGGPLIRWMQQRALVGLAAMQLGVAEEAVRRAAEYLSGRKQFGRPLSTFQAAAHRAVDAHIDSEAMRVTLWQAAAVLAEGRDAEREVLVAKWWASDAGQRVVHAAQHLHGGMGADIDYPVHRYFLWGKQIEVMLGGAAETLERLGAVIAASVRQDRATPPGSRVSSPVRPSPA